MEFLEQSFPDVEIAIAHGKVVISFQKDISPNELIFFWE